CSRASSSYVPQPSEIYTLALHDALPISGRAGARSGPRRGRGRRRDRPPAQKTSRRRSTSAGRRAESSEGSESEAAGRPERSRGRDRKSTRLNSSHGSISYAVFCLKKKTK